MSLHDGVTLVEGIFVVFLACAAIVIGTYLYRDEKAKIEAIRAKKQSEGKLG